MAETETASILRRKAAGAPKAAAPTPGDVLAGDLPRAADEAAGLDLTVREVAPGPETIEALLEALPENALLCLLAGPGDGRGVAILDPALATAVVEAQTTGTVSQRPVGGRVPTGTDAALAAPLLDRALGGLDAALAGKPAAQWACAYRYHGRAADARMLGFYLEATAHRSFRLTLELGGGARTGTLLLALPAVSRRDRAAAGRAAAEAAQADEAADFQRTLLACDARLEARIARLRLPVSRVSALAAGELLALPDARLDRVPLHGPDGAVVAEGRLGQTRGHRAVRVHRLATRDDPPPRTDPFEAAKPAAARVEGPASTGTEPDGAPPE